MNADKPKCPSPRRGEVRQRGQCLREKLSRHHLKASDRRATHAHAECPESSAMTVFRSALVKPTAVKAQVVVEASGRCIEGVMKKCGGCGGYAQYSLGLFAQLTKQHREDKRARIIIGAVAFGKIWNAEYRVLEDSGGIRHPAKMIQLQLRQLAGPLVECLINQRSAREACSIQPR